MNLFLARRKAIYFLTARHRGGHGIHSPFLYKFIEGLRNKPGPAVVNSVEEVRRELKRSHKQITVNDLGSGSLIMKGNRRRIADIARYSAVNRRYGRVLFNLAAIADGMPLVELGTSLGIGTLYLARGAPNSTVYTIEGCSATAAVAEANFRRAGAGNIVQRVGDIADLLPPLLEETGAPGLLFIDANHTGEALQSYYRAVRKHIVPDTIIVMDDIHLTPGMERGWLGICSDPGITLSVDLLQMGILFFRQGVRRQHFVVRY